ncbi:hypothetical protein [Glutamicibacter uratoxydans]|nr:hypothetical protein [Glutamicibacter uratoxydans]
MPALQVDEKVIEQAARDNRHALYDREMPAFWGFSSESDAQDYGFEEGAKWALEQLAHHLESSDERIAAWDWLCRHPAFRPCYQVDKPLADAMSERLSELLSAEKELEDG